jgi:hypothetical protein
MEEVNKISPKLKAIVDAARPKKGQVIYFESLRPKAGGTNVPTRDRIFDPFLEEQVDIGYTTGSLPARGNMPPQLLFGEVKFKRGDGNIIPIYGDNTGGGDRFLFMFLTNYNKTNMGKEWYSPRDGQGFMFQMQIPEKTSAEKNAFRRKVRQAGEKIDVMPDSKLLDFALSLELPRITEFSKMEEIRDRLYEIAEKNPDKVMSMDKDVNLNMTLFIKKAIKYNLWEENKALKLFVWPETKDPVFLMTPGQDLYGETIKYLLGTGQDTYKLVKNLIDKAEEKETKKNANKPKVDGTVADAIVKSKAAGDNSPDKKFVPQYQEVNDD